MPCACCAPKPRHRMKAATYAMESVDRLISVTHTSLELYSRSRSQNSRSKPPSNPDRTAKQAIPRCRGTQAAVLRVGFHPSPTLETATLYKPIGRRSSNPDMRIGNFSRMAKFVVLAAIFRGFRGELHRHVAQLNIGDCSRVLGNGRNQRPFLPPMVEWVSARRTFRGRIGRRECATRRVGPAHSDAGIAPAGLIWRNFFAAG